MSLINISICLTDLPKNKIKQSENNGKKYINLCVASRKEVGKYGETHTVHVSKTKEERESGAPVIYVGYGKEFNPQPAPATYENTNSMPAAYNTDDLPF
ncbi:MAG: hypothetical protein LBS88_04170 [Tannerellaceae bacterium]|jgi:hypothetical protein|nr:hypothetical protein [Tannerellaceae bacterium]